MRRKCFHIWQCCALGGGVRVFLFVGGVSISCMCLLGECIHGQREGLVATCGLMLAELHVGVG